MDAQAADTFGVVTTPLGHGDSWIQNVIGLLDIATQQLESSKEDAQRAIEQATSLLQQRVQPPSREGSCVSRGLLAWQVRKVREYLDTHISGRVLVADLSAIVSLSEAHFSRSFKQTFALTPHAFLLRLRVELAARLLLESAESLTQIALRCGFTDQAHFCKHFRRSMGETPAAWRRACRGAPV